MITLPDDLFTVPFRMQPGLRRITQGATHFTPIKPGDAAFDEKLAVLRDAAQDGLLIAAGFDAQPALLRVLEVLSLEHPQHVQRVEDGYFLHALNVHINPYTDKYHCESPIINKVSETIDLLVSVNKPVLWSLLSLSVLEDLAVLCAPMGELNLLAVCLPSHWAPQDKIGKPFVQVHAPVADNALLLQAAQGLMRLVTVKSDDRWERYVWTMTPSLALDGHPARCHREWLKTDDEHALLASTVFRLERQTFIALPDYRQAIFTIAVHTAPVLEALDKPQLQALHSSLASMSDAVLAYRSFTPVRDAWLRGINQILS